MADTKVSALTDGTAPQSADAFVVARAGASFKLTWSQLTSGITIAASQVSDFNEAVDDRVAALIQNGTGISWSYNDGAGTLTPTVSLAAFSTTNLAEGTNLYYTDERAQDAVGGILTDSSRIDLSYNDGAGTITADIVADSVSNTYLANMAQSTIKGRAEGAGTGDPADLTVDEVMAILGVAPTSWTPTITFATPGNLSVAYTHQAGTYIQIGKLVIAWFSIQTSTFTHTTASGALRLGTLPVTPSFTGNMFPTFACEWTGITKANYTQVSAVVQNAVTFLIFNAYGSGQVISTIVAADTPSGGQVTLRGAVIYQAA